MTTVPISHRPGRGSEYWFVFVWLIVSLWLLACAFLVGGETGDGYQTIANARYFFGDTENIYVQRGPLAAFFLWPVETVVTVFNLDALDVRPYHFYSAVLHSAYLVGCWLLLKRSAVAFAARIAAFIVSILTVAFYANSPFLSHDVIPGLLFLIFIFVCDRWLREPTPGGAAILVVLGAAVVLIKQTYAIFWVSIAAYTVVAYVFRWDGHRVSVRKTLLLLGLGGLSAMISWLAYGWFLGADIPTVALLERPLRLIRTVSTQYELGAELATLFPWDLYVRNWQNYGVTAVLLLVPGIVLAFRGRDARMRMIAVCLLVCLVLMQITEFREVRYLIFLAPLTAMLVAPVIAIVLKSRVGVLLLMATVAVDQYRGLTMAVAQLSLSNSMDVARFVGGPGSTGTIVSSNHMSFAYMARSPMIRDRYHGLFHLTADHVDRLYEGALEVRQLADPRDLGLVGAQPGDRVLYSNRTVVRQPPWQVDNTPFAMDQLVLTAGFAMPIELNRREDHFVIDGQHGRFVMLIPDAGIGPVIPLIINGQIAAADLESIYTDVAGRTLQKTGVVLDAICQADSCSYFD